MTDIHETCTVAYSKGLTDYGKPRPNLQAGPIALSVLSNAACFIGDLIFRRITGAELRNSFFGDNDDVLSMYEDGAPSAVYNAAELIATIRAWDSMYQDLHVVAIQQGCMRRIDAEIAKILQFALDLDSNGMEPEMQAWDKSRSYLRDPINEIIKAYQDAESA